MIKASSQTTAQQISDQFRLPDQTGGRGQRLQEGYLQEENKASGIACVAEYMEKCLVLWETGN